MVDQDAAHHCMMGSLKEACTKLTIWREMAQWPVSDPDLKDQSLTPEGGGDAYHNGWRSLFSPSSHGFDAWP